MPTGPQLQVQHLQHFHIMPNTTDDDGRALISALGEWWAATQAAITLEKLPNLAVNEIASDSTELYDAELHSCPECGQHVDVMVAAERDQHVIRDGLVLVGCEGYFTRTFVNAVRAWVRSHAAQGQCSLVQLQYPNSHGLRGLAPGDRVRTSSHNMAGTVWVVYDDGAVDLEWDANDPDDGPYEDHLDTLAASLLRHA